MRNFDTLIRTVILLLLSLYAAAAPTDDWDDDEFTPFPTQSPTYENWVLNIPASIEDSANAQMPSCLVYIWLVGAILVINGQILH